MNSLDAFLAAEDLDELLKARERLTSPSAEDSRRVSQIVVGWQDRQAIANLLMYPTLIPEAHRFEAITRAFRTADVPYFAVAATVGLQTVPVASIPQSDLQRLKPPLLQLLKSSSPLAAGRASVTLFSWGMASADVAAWVLSAAPVADAGANRNITALALSLFGDLDQESFAERLAERGVPPMSAAVLAASHAEHLKARATNELRALMARHPVHVYIPNLRDQPDSAPPPRRKRPWWLPW